ncbi:hypothetical protein TURU_055820 [Turdus rufiventris]|nr:hypothetical protein TURU_055820 [Turdus rufiventris]
MHKELGGSTARTADPNRSKEYSMRLKQEPLDWEGSLGSKTGEASGRSLVNDPSGLGVIKRMEYFIGSEAEEESSFGGRLLDRKVHFFGRPTLYSHNIHCRNRMTRDASLEESMKTCNTTDNFYWYWSENPNQQSQESRK